MLRIGVARTAPANVDAASNVDAGASADVKAEAEDVRRAGVEAEADEVDDGAATGVAAITGAGHWRPLLCPPILNLPTFSRAGGPGDVGRDSVSSGLPQRSSLALLAGELFGKPAGTAAPEGCARTMPSRTTVFDGEAEVRLGGRRVFGGDGVRRVLGDLGA